VPTFRRLGGVFAAAFFVLGFCADAALAQNWPNRFVKLIVPYPPGGGATAIARIVSAKLSDMWGQQIVVENRGGAGGNLASELAARSDPDGYTLYLGGEFLSTNGFLYPKLTYDPIADLVPVSLVVQYPTALVVPNSSPANSVKEFIAHAKTNRGKLTFATPGHGTGPHLAGELFKRSAGIELTHVPYRGAGPALNDVLPGRVDSFFNNIAPVLPLMQQGQLRILGISTGKRVASAAQLPTFAEAGLTGFDVAGWYAFFFPAKTPPEIVRKVHADTVTALADPVVKERLEQLGLIIVGSTPQQLGAYLKAEMDKWEPVIKAAGIKVE
jgi:tripartite-type tricarboxylate transporter receptor subunit TctC